jgi:hypothetical protein
MSGKRLPKQSARRATSNERAVRLPAQTGVDRRAATRYRLTLGVRYVVENQQSGVATTGLGQTVDLSTCGVRFTTDSSLEPGLRVKLFIEWPALLDGAIELQLTMEGIVVRSSNNEVSLRIERHSFRTRGRGLKTA